tara:strand:- start:89881 stop:90594 length:714 start_codon:yes stop_codon:yes gene_type:complete
MKRVFTLLIFISISLNSFAQDPQIFGQSWRCEGVTLDTGTYIPTPIVANSYHPYGDFYPDSAIISFCEAQSTQSVFSGTENVFNLEGDIAIIGGPCDTSTQQSFQSLYFGVYWEANDVPINPFTYTILDDGDTKLLQVENANGAIAHYTNATLNVTDFKDVTIALYPNPANERITIASNDASIENLSIFNIHGQEVMTVKFQQNKPTLNISNLQAGVYFLKAESDTGQQLTTKFVKQ